MLLLVMAYRLLREFRQASTRLDTPPFSNRHHLVSAIARAEQARCVLRQLKFEGAAHVDVLVPDRRQPAQHVIRMLVRRPVDHRLHAIEDIATSARKTGLGAEADPFQGLERVLLRA